MPANIVTARPWPATGVWVMQVARLRAWLVA